MRRSISDRHTYGLTQEKAFSLMEVIIAASILGIGLLSIIQAFPYGIQVSQRAEDLTQATLLAQSLFEGLKTDPVNYPIIPGYPSVLIPIPGNAYDDDTDNRMFSPRLRGNAKNAYDLNNNLMPDVDYDGMPEWDGVTYNPAIRGNGIDDDGDGVVDDSGDSNSTDRRAVPRNFALMAMDGDYHYDPEPNIDEEYADGIDNDRDGLIDEDVRLPSVRIQGSSFMLPLLAGDGIDNDGDSTDRRFRDDYFPQADGIDNNGNGMIDEGIDEEIWNGKDDDGDGLIDEDCRLAAFPFSVSQFPEPYSRYSWQIQVGRVPDNGRFGFEDVNNDGVPDLGDGIDNDGDGLIDEEIRDGLDYDFPVRADQRRGISYLRNYIAAVPKSDGLVDEDCIASPLPNWRRVEILITWGGDGVDNDGDLTRVDPKSQANLGFDDPSSVRSSSISYGNIEWGIDEEKLDGIDNDLDGQVDEDTYLFDYKLVGFINLKDPTQSFVMSGGVPRGVFKRQ
jgi:type II secretory pathway pseudopilin PulG